MGILNRLGAEALGIDTTPGRLLCGADLGDGVVCREPAGTMHVTHVLAAKARDEAERADTEALLNQADHMIPAKGLHEVLTGVPLPSYAEMRAKYDKPVPSTVEVADERRPLPEWSCEYKLRHVLGRPSLARRLCAHLEPAEAAELAEVLDGLFERSMVAVQRAVDEVTEETLARMHEDAQTKLREVRDERFRGHSRLG